MCWDLIIFLPSEPSRIGLDMLFPSKFFFLFAQSPAECKHHPHPSKQPTFLYYIYFGVQCLTQGHLRRWADIGNLCKCFSPLSLVFSYWKSACNEQQAVKMKRQRAVSSEKTMYWLVRYTFEPYFHYSKERASVQYLQTGLDLEKPLKSRDLECGYENIQIFPREGTGDKQ